MKYMKSALVVVGCCFAASAAAQSMKPGLWEVTHKTSGGGADMSRMQEQMASMPPEQRKMMEEMMAKQGIKMGAGGAMSVKTCVTKEMADRNEMPAHQGDCKYTSQQRTGNTTKVAFTCATPPSKGETQFTVISPEAYTMKATITSTASGKPETHVTEGSGKWLSADCGSVKPPVMPKGK